MAGLTLLPYRPNSLLDLTSSTASRSFSMTKSLQMSGQLSGCRPSCEFSYEPSLQATGTMLSVDLYDDSALAVSAGVAIAFLVGFFIRQKRGRLNWIIHDGAATRPDARTCVSVCLATCAHPQRERACKLTLICDGRSLRMSARLAATCLVDHICST